MFELTPFVRRGNAVVGYNPFREMEDMEKRLFGSAMNTFHTDIREKGDSYLIEADLPGFDKANIHVDVDGDTLTVTAERAECSKEEKNRYLRKERACGKFTRSFDISAVDAAGISVAYTDGVLQLTLPKKKENVTAARRLEIQ